MNGLTRAPVHRDLLLAAVGAAVLAPSLRNSQPWRFRLDADMLEVYSDPVRRLPIADLTGGAARIACGAAAANAQLRLAAAGVQTRLVLGPDQHRTDLLIRLDPTGTGAPSADEITMAAAIERRHDNRRRFQDLGIPAGAGAALRAVADTHGAWLEILTGRLSHAFVSGIVDAADQALRGTPGYLGELAVGGVPNPADNDSFRFTPVLGSASEPVVAVLGTARDDPHDQVTAGIALEHVLLAATDAGLSVSLRYQPIQVPSAREELRRGLRSSGAPQIVARIGYAPRGRPPARRAVAAVLVGASPGTFGPDGPPVGGPD